MKERKKYQGIIPAFYACYGENGEISKECTQTFARHLMRKGVAGLYVSGSSGECIYQSIEERKQTVRYVMEEVCGKIPVIMHVACNNTKDSQELASYAQDLGVDAIASIPPIYFHLPEHAIAEYWNSISAAAPDTDFIIYNIPQLAGTSLTQSLLKTMLKNQNVIGVKNSSIAVQDIQIEKMIGGNDFVVFNGVDEQFISGYAMGADGGIGGTYGVMPELFLKMDELLKAGDYQMALNVQMDVDHIIYRMCECHGSMYAVIKEILKKRENINIGTVREPLPQVTDSDMGKINDCILAIDTAVSRYC